MYENSPKNPYSVESSLVLQVVISDLLNPAVISKSANV